jgi:hypothetical protein
MFVERICKWILRIRSASTNFTEPETDGTLKGFRLRIKVVRAAPNRTSVASRIHLPSKPRQRRAACPNTPTTVRPPRVSSPSEAARHSCSTAELPYCLQLPMGFGHDTPSVSRVPRPSGAPGQTSTAALAGKVRCESGDRRPVSREKCSTECPCLCLLIPLASFHWRPGVSGERI